MAGKKPNRTHIWISVMLAVITIAAFYRTLGNDFIVAYDDGSYITTNEDLQYGLSAEGIAWAFSTNRCSNWHPITWLSHLLDFDLYGLDPAGHHATNLLLHLANVMLLFLFLRRLTRSEWRSAFVAALFAVHPLHVESVAWVAERKDVLSTLFWILTMWAYVRFVEQPDLRRRLTVIVLFALGLMSKPTLVTLPFTLLLLDYWPLGRLGQRKGQPLRKLIWEKWPLFLMSAVSSVITIWAQASGKSIVPSIELPMEWRVGNALISYIAYLWKMIWPVKMAVLYPWTQHGISYLQALGSLVLLVAITIAVFRFAGRRPYLKFGWLWYVITLVPVIGILQVGEQTIADRYTYVPLIGIFVMAAWLPGQWGTGVMGRLSRKALPIMAMALIAALMVSSWVYVGYWKNSISLCERAVAVTKDNFSMHLNLAIAYGEEERWQDSIREYREAIKILPRDHQAHTNLAIILYAFGDYAESWKEVHICEDLGHPMHQGFVDDLSARMPEPK